MATRSHPNEPVRPSEPYHGSGEDRTPDVTYEVLDLRRGRTGSIGDTAMAEFDQPVLGVGQSAAGDPGPAYTTEPPPRRRDWLPSRQRSASEPPQEWRRS